MMNDKFVSKTVPLGTDGVASRGFFFKSLDAAQVAAVVKSVGCVAAIGQLLQDIEAAYLRWDAFQKVPRQAFHHPLGVVELMPIADQETFAFKYVNGHPGNPSLGVPTVLALGMLSRMSTGEPLLLADLTLLTALRTAATSVLAAKLMARPASKSMALIGNGAQAEFQALAFVGLLGIQELRLFDVDPSATAKLVRNLKAAGALESADIVLCQDAKEAVRGADIVTTATADKCLATILTADMVAPGQHINAIGGDCPGKTELAPGVLAQAVVLCEYAPQTRIEGDIQQMGADFPVVELADALASARRGGAPLRASAQAITVFDSVGFALEDLAALGWLAKASQGASIGSRFGMVEGEDPKDLFAELR